MRIIVLTLISLFFCVSAHAENTDPAIGYWKTIDDVTGKPKSIIQLSENSDHQLQGTVIKIFSETNPNQHKICKACEGDKHNQPIVGMTILTDLKKDDNQWSGGKILDPVSGKIYKCKLHTLAEGTQLNIRGYIGLSILGRSQTWVRVDKPKIA